MRINFEFDPDKSPVYPWSWHIETNVQAEEEFPGCLGDAHFTLSEAMEAAQDRMAELADWFEKQFELTIL